LSAVSKAHLMPENGVCEYDKIAWFSDPPVISQFLNLFLFVNVLFP
jgi:hypothetical protein